MVFSSPPSVYLDPPNWQQQPIQHRQEGGGGGGGSRENNNNHHHNLSLPPPTVGGGGGSGTGSIRPGSMTDRARLAKIPQPEAALKCPRCDSTNTKFCYFNNYSLTQPRHFCKTCRRYWTRGGALRNVPVGGGCRRNKRSSKGSRSKSPATASDPGANSITSSSTSSVLIPSTATGSDMIGQFPPQHLPNFLTHLNHHLGEYGGSGDLGLSFGGIQAPIGTAPAGSGGRENNNNNMEFQIGGGFGEQWRLQQGNHQFPFLNGLQPPPAGMYPFEAEASEPPQGYSGHQQQPDQQLIRSKALDTAMAAVKMEDKSHQGLNLSRNFLGISGTDQNQYWVGGGGGGGNGTNGWTDLAGFTNSSSSTRHLL